MKSARDCDEDGRRKSVTISFQAPPARRAGAAGSSPLRRSSQRRPRPRSAPSARCRRGTPRPVPGSRRRSRATHARSASTRRRVSASSASATSLLPPPAPAARPRPGRPRGIPPPAKTAARISPTTEAVETATREHHRVQPALASLSQASVDVPAERLDRQRRLEREQLGAAPHRRRADAHARPHLRRPAQRVARIVTLEIRRQRPPDRPVSDEVMSFAECTATSIRPSSSASSSSLTKTPRAPISPNAFVRSRSPAVVIGTSAISTPGRRKRSDASSACVSASREPREPTLSSIALAHSTEPSSTSSATSCWSRASFVAIIATHASTPTNTTR